MAVSKDATGRSVHVLRPTDGCCQTIAPGATNLALAIVQEFT